MIYPNFIMYTNEFIHRNDGRYVKGLADKVTVDQHKFTIFATILKQSLISGG